MNHRAYSILAVKSVDKEQRIITGMATTPTPDRIGDIVEPLGVQFKNPMPLLWQHRSDKPVGTVEFEKPTKTGIKFKAQFAKPTESAELIARVDEAWESVKLGLVTAVSIGFREKEWSRLDDGGLRFIESEVLELSLVTVPANAEATIDRIKSIDAGLLAASGHRQAASPRTAGVSASSITTKTMEGRSMPKSIADQMSAFNATRTAKAARMKAIMEAAGEETTTLDAADAEEYDRLETEIKALDEHLVRLQKLDESNRKQAVEVVGTSVEAASTVRSGVRVEVRGRTLPVGIAFARIAIAKALASLDMRPPVEIAKERWPNHPEIELMLRAAVGSGTTSGNNLAATPPEWGGALAQYTNAANEFVEYLWPRTIIGRIPGLTRVPFRVKVPRQTQVAAVNWVGEGRPKPLGFGAFDTIQLDNFKIAGIVALTEELVRFSNPSAEALTREMLANGIVKFMDGQFVDPNVAAVANINPASITWGVTPVPASGTTYAAFVNDVKQVLSKFDGAEIDSGIVVLMKTGLARSMGLMLNALGQPQFPGMSETGGTMLGFPVITSGNLLYTDEDSPPSGSPIIFLHAASILLADDGSVTIDISREASVQMDSAPTHPVTAAQTLVSFWQHNMVGVRAERMVAWMKARAQAVQYISGALYG